MAVACRIVCGLTRLVFKVGMVSWDATENVNDSVGGASGTGDGSDLFYGFGGAYRFNDSWAIVGEYTIYSFESTVPGFTATNTFDVNVLAVSLTYTFGQ